MYREKAGGEAAKRMIYWKAMETMDKRCRCGAMHSRMDRPLLGKDSIKEI